jgi:UPF0271 protein
MKVDINSDLGESFGSFTMGNDAEVMKYITSANIACGFHAGDPVVMEKTVRLALENKVAIGAHPGYPDLMGFGRRKMDLTPAEVRAYVFYQVAALKAVAEALGGKLQHVKAHGALYNEAAENESVAKAIAEAIMQLDPNLIFVGLAHSVMLEIARKMGLQTASEVFADRAYTRDGKLVPRSQPEAVIHDPEICNQRVLQMLKSQTVQTIDGSEIQIKADTICIHGDNPAALELASSLRNHLEKNGVEIQALKA